MSIIQSIKQFLPKLALSIMVFLVFFVSATLYKKNIKKVDNEKLIQYDIRLLLYYTILIIGVLCSIIPLGINPLTFITLFGATGIAIALSLQGVLTNMVSGIYISVNDLFKIGDVIEIVDRSGNHYTGTVTFFSLFNTTVLTDKKINIIIPNTYIQNNIIQKL